MDEKGKAMVGCAGLTLRRTARRAREALGTWDPPAQTQAGLGPGRAPSRSSRRVPGGVVGASTAFRALVRRRYHLGRRIKAHSGRIASE